MLTKKKVIFTTALATSIFVVLYTNYLSHAYCVTGSSCASLFKLAKLIFLISPVLFLVGVASYFLREEIFLSLKKMTLYFLPVYLLILFFAPWEGNAFFRIEKGTMAIFLCGVYGAISLILIIKKSIQLRGK